MKVKEENNKRYGKWILRKTFEKHIPFQIAWRRKSPMQEGAGTSGLTNLFESIINEESYVEKKLTVEKNDEVVIRSRESMYYYEIFKNYTVHRLMIMQNTNVHIVNMRSITQNSVECVEHFLSKHYSYTYVVF